MLLLKKELIAVRPHPSASWASSELSSAKTDNRNKSPMLNITAPSTQNADIAASKRAVQTISRACMPTRSRPEVSLADAWLASDDCGDVICGLPDSGLRQDGPGLGEVT